MEPACPTAEVGHNRSADCCCSNKGNDSGNGKRSGDGRGAEADDLCRVGCIHRGSRGLSGTCDNDDAEAESQNDAESGGCTE